MPWHALLNGSFYYPACGTDGRPVQYFGGYCHSFIYADYCYSFENISVMLGESNAFWGYRLASSRLLQPDEFNLTADWNTLGLNRQLDGNPASYKRDQVSPYAYWCIFERDPTKSEAHGPEAFSLIYLGMEGVAAFHASYVAQNAVPSMVALVQPCEGFGRNWTNFYDVEKIFARTVLGNPGGKPTYLLLGGFINKAEQQELIWPEYNNLIRFWKFQRRQYLGLWKKHP